MPSKAHPPDTGEGDPWAPGSYSRDILAQALLDSGAAGVNSHDRPNMLWKMKRLTEADPDVMFGISGVDRLSFEEVLALVADAAGFPPEPAVRHGLVQVDPEPVIDACAAVGDRLAEAARRGERVILATGHPAGLPLLYQAVGRLLTDRGAKLLQPLEGVTWREQGRKRRVRYFHGVAMLIDRASPIHTHSPEPMRRMLEEATPDLVFADHGFAGAAIEAGIDVVSIADINDPALVVAHQQGRGGPVIVMDDNVEPEDYWPCFQVIASRFTDA